MHGIVNVLSGKDYLQTKWCTWKTKCEFNTKSNFKNFVRSQRSASHSACYGDPRRTAQPCLPLATVPSPIRVFPLCHKPTTWFPGIFPRHRRYVHFSLSLPACLSTEAEWLVAVPVLAAPVWHKRAWLDLHTAMSAPCTLVYITIILSHINNLYLFYFFCSGPDFLHFGPLFGNFILAH